MASKITGAQIDFDPGAPLIDVDTAIEDLAEDLGRAGRRRQLIALQHLCAVAQSASRESEAANTGNPDMDRHVEAAENRLREDGRR